MTLYQPRRFATLPLAPVWRALSRHNVGIEHYADRQGWHVEVKRLTRVPDGYVLTPVLKVTHDDELDVVIDALPVLPGVGPRLALISLLLERMT